MAQERTEMGSFFGFETNLPAESDEEEESGNKRSPISDGMQSTLETSFATGDMDEKKYDALNHETFDSLYDGDWEGVHEKLVRLDEANNGPILSGPGEADKRDQKLLKQVIYDTNNESGRSSVVAQSIGEQFTNKLRIDPTIWDGAVKPLSTGQHRQHQTTDRSHVLSPSGPCSSHYADQTGKKPLQLPLGPLPPKNIPSLDDVERNMIQNQQQKNQLQWLQHVTPPSVWQSLFPSMKPFKIMPSSPDGKQIPAVTMPPPVQSQTLLRSPPVTGMKPQGKKPSSLDGKKMPTVAKPSPTQSAAFITPPPLLSTRGVICPTVPPPIPGVPLLNHLSHLPLSILPYNIHLARPLSTPMHPPFSQGYGQSLIQRPPVLPRSVLLQPCPTPLPNNQFNQWLAQTLQQNHPLLRSNVRINNPFILCSNGHAKPETQIVQKHDTSKQQDGDGIPTGKPVEEHDEYANMMSNREKEWQIGFQSSRLQSDTPYFSDYYFTVYKERVKATQSNGKNRSSKRKEKKGNGPDTSCQTDLHAQPHLLAKDTNGDRLTPCRNRESHESKTTCAKGENDFIEHGLTLGCMTRQAGTVRAPRKVIDMDARGIQMLDGNGSTGEHVPKQRKVLHVLLLIERMYEILLQLEDLRNPRACEAAIHLLEGNEPERCPMLEGSEKSGDVPTNDSNEQLLSIAALLNPVKSFEDLSTSLMNQLTQEEVTAILGVRKGKTLLRRTLAVLHEHRCRWTLWGKIFNAQPSLHKRDREDPSGLLMAMATEFERQLRYGTVDDLLLVAKMIGCSSTVMHCIVVNKFLLSCLIAIIFQMEIFYGKNPSMLVKTGAANCTWWLKFLNEVNGIVKESIPASGIETVRSSVTIKPDTNIVCTLRVHFERFKLSVTGTDLLNFITDNGNGVYQAGVAKKQSFQGNIGSK